MSVEREAIEVLKTVGWGKGLYVSSDGKRCLMGAISRASITQPMSNVRRTLTNIEDIILEQFPERFISLGAITPNFNDHPDTTLEDVILVLEKAAIRAEEDG